MKSNNLTIPDIIKELEDEVKFMKNEVRGYDKLYDQNDIWHHSGYIDACGLAISRLKQMELEQSKEVKENMA